MYNTAYSALIMGMKAFQFFLGSPQSFTRRILSEADIEATKQLIDRFDMRVYSHAPYVYNLCGLKNSLAWKDNANVNSRMFSLISSLEYELNTLGKLGGSVIVHPGCCSDRIEGLKTIAETINRMNYEGKLLLENCAGEGSKLCHSFRELKIIYDTVNEDKKSKVGVCLDTAHIFGSGQYDLSKREEIDRMFIEFDNTLGINLLGLVHLNDSEVPFGSKKDRHALLGEGLIWKNLSLLKYFIGRCTKFGVAMVIETNPIDMETILELFGCN